MYNFTELKEAVEAEYDAYFAYRRDEQEAGLEAQTRVYDTSRMFELLSDYLTRVVKSLTRANTAINEYDIEDIVNDALTDIVGGGLKRFRKEGALFTTFCYAIAKNKVRDFQRKNCHVCLEDAESLQILSDQQIGQVYREGDSDSPEHQVLIQECRLEAILFLKKYIKTLMNWNCGPIRNVVCCFSLILYHRYFPDSRKKASPKWAYEQLEIASVRNGSERFVSEMTEWMPWMESRWSNKFAWQLYEKHENIMIGEIIFGKHFKLKDFSNWTERVSKEVQKYLLKSEVKANAASEL